MKKTISVLAAICLALSLCACVSTKAPDDGRIKNIEVTVIHSDGTEKVFSYTTDMSYLGDILQKEELIRGKNGQYGLEISHVDGEAADYNTDGAYWALYEGDTYATKGVDTLPIKDGGRYKLVYTVG